MYRLTAAFMYGKKKSWIHELDPRSKLLLSAATVLISALSENLLTQAALLLAETLIGAAGKEVRRFLNSIILVSPFFIFVFLVNFFLGRNFMLSLTLAVRLLVMVGGFSIFFIYTPPEDFILMLESLKVPLFVSFSFSLALRFIPVMAEETQRIIDAQKSRGLRIDSKNPLKRMRMTIPIFIPLIISSIKRSIEVAEALEVRGFDPSKKRTSLIKLEMRVRDHVITFSTILLTLAYLTAKLLLNPMI